MIVKRVVKERTILKSRKENEKLIFTSEDRKNFILFLQTL